MRGWVKRKGALWERAAFPRRAPVGRSIGRRKALDMEVVGTVFNVLEVQTVKERIDSRELCGLDI